MHINQVIWHEENIGTVWETSHQCCVMRKVILKKLLLGKVRIFSGLCRQSYVVILLEMVVIIKDNCVIILPLYFFRLARKLYCFYSYFENVISFCSINN